MPLRRPRQELPHNPRQAACCRRQWAESPGHGTIAIPTLSEPAIRVPRRRL